MPVANSPYPVFRYYSDCAEATPSKFAQREDDAEKLWELSEKLVGCQHRPFDLT